MIIRKRITGSIPLLLSALAVVFLTALPSTPPARPDRDLGFSVSRRVSVCSNSRSNLNRFGGGSGLAFDSESGTGTPFPALFGPVQVLEPGLSGVTLVPWAPFCFSFDFKKAFSSRSPPAA